MGEERSRSEEARAALGAEAGRARRSGRILEGGAIRGAPGRERSRARRDGPASARRWFARVLAAGLAAAALALAVAAPPAWAETPGPVDLNRASLAELMALPGIGEAKARAIVQHRKTAPFHRKEELLQVKGIGESIYARVRDRVAVSPKREEDPGAGGR